jgi:hypothetical protein
MKSIKSTKVQDEVFYKLVEATAQSGVFALGELKSGKEAQSIAKHLKGVSEIIAAVYTEEGEEESK